jgi:hypothetical protein
MRRKACGFIHHGHHKLNEQLGRQEVQTVRNQEKAKPELQYN